MTYSCAKYLWLLSRPVWVFLLAGILLGGLFFAYKYYLVSGLIVIAAAAVAEFAHLNANWRKHCSGTSGDIIRVANKRIQIAAGAHLDKELEYLANIALDSPVRDKKKYSIRKMACRIDKVIQALIIFFLLLGTVVTSI